MRNKALTILLLITLLILIGLSIANLIISKSSNSRVDRLISDRISQALQSPQLQDTINTSIQGDLSQINVTPKKGDPGQSIIGTQGIQGTSGTNGKNGVSGINGSNGESAYDIWLSHGNAGTEQDFLNSLIGPKGDQGPPGEVLQLQWSATGILQQKYSGDDFYITVPSIPIQ